MGISVYRAGAWRSNISDFRDFSTITGVPLNHQCEGVWVWHAGAWRSTVYQGGTPGLGLTGFFDCNCVGGQLNGTYSRYFFYDAQSYRTTGAQAFDIEIYRNGVLVHTDRRPSYADSGSGVAIYLNTLITPGTTNTMYGRIRNIDVFGKEGSWVTSATIVVIAPNCNPGAPC